MTKCVGLAGLCALFLGLFGQAALADYPEKPVRMIVPYAPGGGTDTFARRLAVGMGKELGQEVVVQNIGGAGGNLGMKAAADAAPDGYTIVFALNSQYAVNVSLFKDMPFDPIKDFAPVTLLGSAPYMLVVHPSLNVSTVEDVIALAKQKPGELSYGSAGVGSGAHLATEMLKTMAGVDMLHIPYKGAGDAYPDLVSGRLQVMFSTIAPIRSYVNTGRLKAIAVAGPKRSPVFPDLPPVADTLPGYDANTWYAIAAPAGTPKAVVDRLNKAALAGLKEPEIRQQLETDAIDVIGSTPEEFAAYLPLEIKKWAAVIKASGATAQ